MDIEQEIELPKGILFCMRELFLQEFICGAREVVAIGGHPVGTLLV